MDCNEPPGLIVIITNTCRMKNIGTLLLPICLLITSVISGQEKIPHDIQKLPRINEADSLALCRLPELPVPPLYQGPGAPQLPVVVDNTELIYWRPVFNQVGYECGQASGVGHNYTYQINRLRNLPSDIPDNQYPTHFCWNFGNGGDGYYGVSYFHSFEIIRMNGTPNVTDYGGTMSYGGPKRWMSGYNEYYNGMHNRISEAYQIDVSAAEGVMTLKHWIHDHLNGSDAGGVASFYAACPYGMPTLPPGTPEAGKYVMTDWGGYANHAMCIGAYHDSIRWDYNNDGQYTNHIDINGDNKVDVRDWEIGGLKFSNNYGGGPSWGNEGFCYMMYKTLAEIYGSGGIWNNAVHVLYAKENTEPLLTAKITLKHVCRKMIRIRIGMSQDSSATYPDFTLILPIFNFQGGCYYMQGGDTEEDKTIEFGLDLSFLLNYAGTGNEVKYFLLVDEDDPNQWAPGEVVQFSLIDYTQGGLEIPYSGSNIPLVDNGTTTLGISHTVDFTPVAVTTSELPPATVYEPYSHQLSASGGNEPYDWDYNLNFIEESGSFAYPSVSAEQLYPTNNDDGYVIKSIEFAFPFYDSIYTQVTAYVDGYFRFGELLEWPYQVYDFLAFTKNRFIAPFMADLIIYPALSDGMWYEGNSEYAIFRWRVSVQGQYGDSQLNFAVKLFKNGRVEYYYGDVNNYSNIDWISGLSCGNNKYYQFTEVNNDLLIPQNHRIGLDPYFAPEGFSVTPDGAFSGIPEQAFDDFPVRFMVTDRDNLSHSKVLPFSTDGANYLVIKEVEVKSGGDELIEFGEHALLSVTLENLGGQVVTGAEMELNTDDPYITLIDSTEVLGDFQPGETKILEDVFSFDVGNDLPNNHDIDLATLITDDAGDEWESHIYLMGYAPVMHFGYVVVEDEGNGILEPGETANLLVSLVNTGGAALHNAIAEISTDNTFIIVNSASDTIPVFNAGSAEEVQFNVTAASGLPPGFIVEFELEITGDNNFNDAVLFFLIPGYDAEDFETGDFSKHPWAFGGEADWFVTGDNPYEGIYCARSGDVGDYESSALNLQVCFLTDGEIGFYRKVSSEPTYDFLHFYVDGTLKESWSGEEDWAYVSYPVNHGNHFLSWVYEKDVSISSGEDCGWVDLITFPYIGDENPVLEYAPDSFEVFLEQGTTMTELMTLTNAGDSPLLYFINVEETEGIGWLELEFESGSLNPGEYDDIEVIFNSSGITTGSYSCNIEISDHAENTYSLPATLTVTPQVTVGENLFSPPVCEVFPNPFNNRTRILIRNNRKQPLRLDILDMKGNILKTLFGGEEVPEGNYSWHWDKDEVAAGPGVYFIRLVYPEGMVTRKAVLLR